MPFIDLTGKSFGLLKVVETKLVCTKRGNRKICTCICECGEVVERRADGFKSGRISSCGCYNKITILKAVDKITLNGPQSAFNSLFSSYKKEASKKKYFFGLTEETFKELIDSTCFYCGKKPKQVSKSGGSTDNYTYNGIDRLNSDLGYIKSNCVPCCKTCNYMKRTLSPSSFIKHISKIYNYQYDHIQHNSGVYDFDDVIAMNVLMWEYKKNARTKGIKFNISKSTFHSLTKGICEYCGTSPKSIRFTPNRKRRYTFNGIDRVDNKSGYKRSNCVPCCKECNYMKRAHSKQQFLAHVDRVFEYKTLESTIL